MNRFQDRLSLDNIGDQICFMNKEVKCKKKRHWYTQISRKKISPFLPSHMVSNSSESRSGWVENSKDMIDRGNPGIFQSYPYPYPHPEGMGLS